MPSLDSGLYLHIMHFHAIDVWKPLLRRRFITAKEHEFWKRTHQSGPLKPCACSDIMAEYSTRAWRSLCERGLSPLHPGRISCSSCLEPWPSESFLSRSWLAWGWAAKEVIFWKLHLLGSGYGSSSYTTSILSFNFSQLNWMIKWTRWATLKEVPCKKPHVMHCRVRIDSLCRFMGSWERCPSSHGGW